MIKLHEVIGHYLDAIKTHEGRDVYAGTVVKRTGDRFVVWPEKFASSPRTSNNLNKFVHFNANDIIEHLVLDEINSYGIVVLKRAAPTPLTGVPSLTGEISAELSGRTPRFEPTSTFYSPCSMAHNPADNGSCVTINGDDYWHIPRGNGPFGIDSIYGPQKPFPVGSYNFVYQLKFQMDTGWLSYDNYNLFDHTVVSSGNTWSGGTFTMGDFAAGVPQDGTYAAGLYGIFHLDQPVDDLEIRINFYRDSINIYVGQLTIERVSDT